MTTLLEKRESPLVTGSKTFILLLNYVSMGTRSSVWLTTSGTYQEINYDLEKDFRLKPPTTSFLTSPRSLRSYELLEPLVLYLFL